MAGERDQSQVTLSVVVPTYREAENLAHLVPAITQVLQQHGLRHEIVIVDDDSRDGTPEVVAQLSRDGHHARLITRTDERGLSSAVIRGFQEATGDVLLCMDADLSHPPSAIPRLLGELQQPGVDFVIGSRYVAGGGMDQDWGLLRWLNSRVATWLARPFTTARDPMAGYFALRRDRFRAAEELNPIGYKIGLELIVKCRCRRIREVPIHFADRKFGESKLDLREQLRYIHHLKRLADYKFGVLSRFVQFCAVGATGLAVDFLTYGLLLRGGVAIHIARAIAIWVALTWNFLLNRRFTFSWGRAGRILQQYPRFVASCLVGAVASWSVAMGLGRTAMFAEHPFVAAFMGVLVGTVLNFTASLLWVFRKDRRRGVPLGRAEAVPEAERQEEPEDDAHWRNRDRSRA